MSNLTAAQRAALPASDFVFPEQRAFPIHDRAHAEAALRLCHRSNIPNACAKVRAAVRARYGMGAKTDAEDRRDGGVDENTEKS